MFGLATALLLTMQCKWTLTKSFTHSTPQRKCPVLRQQSQKMRFVGSKKKNRYIAIIYTISYLQTFNAGYSFGRKHCHGL